MALMGPSGAGKSTLLNVLSLQAQSGRSEGSIKLNGKRLTLDEFKQSCAMVEQEDHQWAHHTAKETLQTAAALWMTTDEETRDARVDELIDVLGLRSCADTKCGGPFVRGLSGGQKRRLSLAVAMLKKPAVLFLDEPTSGLDAASAAGVVSAIKDLAKRSNLIVLATIHQPSLSVYDSFDQVTILSKGRVAYTGPRASAISHFESAGYPLPQFTNPADFILEVVNADFVEDQHQVERILDTWTARCGLAAESESRSSDAGPESDPTKQHEQQEQQEHQRGGASFGRQMKALLSRQLVIGVRDPTVYVGRMVFYLLVCAFFGVVYWNSRRWVVERAQEKIMCLLWMVAVPSAMCIISVYATNLEFKILRKEIRNGFVCPSAYLLSRTIIELPLMLVLAVCALGVGGFGISNFNASAFLPMICIWAGTIWSYECAAQAFAIMFTNPLVGMLSFVMYWFATFIFAGTFLPTTEVVWPLRAFTYVTPYGYATRSLVYLNFHGQDFACYMPPQSQSESCMPQTGGQLMTTIGESTPMAIISDNNTVLQDACALLAIAVVFKVVYFALVLVTTKTAAFVHAPTRRPAIDTEVAKILGRSTSLFV